MTLTVTALLLLAALASIAAPPQSAPAGRHAMDESIGSLVKAFRGVIGVAAIDLDTREELAFNADTRFPTASTIKTAVMLEAYHQIAEGSLTLDSEITLRGAEKVGGSGVLRQLHDGLAFKVSDLLYLMIAFSDNTATNMLVNRLGTARIDDRLASYGFKETRIFRPTFRDGRADVLPELEKEFGLGMTTPREMARLMAAHRRQESGQRGGVGGDDRHARQAAGPRHDSASPAVGRQPANWQQDGNRRGEAARRERRARSGPLRRRHRDRSESAVRASRSTPARCKTRGGRSTMTRWSLARVYHGWYTTISAKDARRPAEHIHDSLRMP